MQILLPWSATKPGCDHGTPLYIWPDDASSRAWNVSTSVHSNEPWLSIEWDRERRSVYAEWKGFANSVDFRASLMKIIDAIRDKHSASLVSDNRRLEGVANQDQLWIRDTWTSLAVAAGLKRIAVVVPHRGLGKIASEEILSQMGTTVFATRTFTTVSEAMDWVVDNEERSKWPSR